MAWSAENATKAYLLTLQTGNKASEPNVTEFISAMAAGNCARLMVEVCSASAGPTTLALAAAAHQTGGRVVCVVPCNDSLHASQTALREAAECVEVVVGDGRKLLPKDYLGADFVLVDCELEGHERVFAAAQVGAARGNGGVVVGYKAFREGSSSTASWTGLRADLLPIGDGLRVSRVAPAGAAAARRRRRSHWVVRVDECTGEEHAFRVASPPSQRKWVEA